MPLLSPQLSQRLPYLGLRSIRLRRSLRNARRQAVALVKHTVAIITKLGD